IGRPGRDASPYLGRGESTLGRENEKPQCQPPVYLPLINHSASMGNLDVGSDWALTGLIFSETRRAFHYRNPVCPERGHSSRALRLLATLLALRDWQRACS